MSIRLALCHCHRAGGLQSGGCLKNPCRYGLPSAIAPTAKEGRRLRSSFIPISALNSATWVEAKLAEFRRQVSISPPGFYFPCVLPCVLRAAPAQRRDGIRSRGDHERRRAGGAVSAVAVPVPAAGAAGDVGGGGSDSAAGAGAGRARYSNGLDGRWAGGCSDAMRACWSRCSACVCA